MVKNLNYLLQSIVIYLLFFVGKIIGLYSSRKLFSFIFLLIAPKFKSSDIVKKNLRIFSTSLSLKEEKKIISNMWKNYGMTFIEYMYLGFFRKNNSHIVIKGEKNLHNLIHNKTSAVFVSGHFANYELMSMEITKRDIKLATIYRPLNNFFLNPLMESLRKKYICKNQIKKGINGVREAIEYIKKGFSIALMIDQRVSEGEKINLFNKLALTTTLPAQLSLKYNLPIIPVFIERTKENNFEITFHEEIKPNEFKSKIDLTAKLNRILEQMIKKNPYQWIWTHNRWK
tara:strand:- start:135 stop:992 length:858 start_codon:yes stop_codon:yes gene_type:complete